MVGNPISLKRCFRVHRIHDFETRQQFLSASSVPHRLSMMWSNVSGGRQGFAMVVSVRGNTRPSAEFRLAYATDPRNPRECIAHRVGSKFGGVSLAYCKMPSFASVYRFVTKRSRTTSRSHNCSDKKTRSLSQCLQQLQL